MAHPAKEKYACLFCRFCTAGGRQDQKIQELRIFYKKAPLKNEISIEISQFFDYIRK